MSRLVPPHQQLHPLRFLDWNLPALPQVVDDLIRRFRSSEEGSEVRELDLSQVIAVFPGRQAGRRFLELLVEKTAGRCLPPQVLTVGSLPELLYEPKQPFASALTQTLAWADALRSTPRAELEVIVPQPPPDEDLDAWMNLGELLARQHRELAADRLNFADVATLGKSLEGFHEQPRWRALSAVQRRYLAILDDLGLWDQQTARLYAIDYQECTIEHDIILVGAVDLTRTLRDMLLQVAGHVQVYVHAPEALADCFDELGVLIPAAWSEQEIPLTAEQVLVVDGPEEQAQQVALELEACCDRFGIDDLSICVPDDRIVPHLTRLLNEFEIETNWLIGQRLPASGPYRLLRALADYLDHQRTDQLSELLRHPDLTDWINVQPKVRFDWLKRWDESVCEHLQVFANPQTIKQHSNPQIQQLFQALRDLFKPFQTNQGRPLHEWAQPVHQFLSRVYSHRSFDTEQTEDRFTVQALKLIRDTCLAQAETPADLMPATTAAQALRMILDQLTGEFLPATLHPAGVHLSGWLDLPLDDAPVAIVTSMNEGLIPSAVNHDLFLPNRLRAHLGIEDNQRRYARDAYALQVVIHSRPVVKLIAARRDVQKEPLVPSRLLFATDAEQVAERVLRFFGESPTTRPSLVTGLSTSRTDHDFKVPQPVLQSEPKRSFAVTEFREYLASPYRYYLNRILGLRSLSDAVVELDPSSFGSLMHAVLQAFGESDEAEQTHPGQIAKFLKSELSRQIREQFGTQPLLPIHIQAEQIRQRLEHFAEWQAEWRRAGWCIRFTEYGYNQNVDFKLHDGSLITLKGRIDRIDFNEQSGAWTILDYKTGESAKDPDKNHRSQGQWTDLQLPLYRHLAAPLGVKGNVQLGYITLPRDPAEIRERIADWSTEDLMAADDVAREIAAEVIKQNFWVEQDRPPNWTDDFAGICQDGVFGQEVYL